MAQVSVLMLDIQGSTPVVKKMGGEAYLSQFMPNFRAMLMPRIERAGREFQKQGDLGDDCVKAIFDSPQDAVACAIEIQNHFRNYGVMHDADGNAVQIKLHLAIHTCPVLSNGSPDVAEIPDLARLLKEASDGHILLSSSCYAAYTDCLKQQKLPPRTCEKFGGYLFKGIEGEQSLYSLLYDDLYRGAPGTQFIGFANVEAANEYIIRVEAEKAVREKFRQTVGGRGGKIRFVTICGEGGMGKTRLSINCARQMAGRFPGSVAFVPLANLLTPTPGAVADLIYQALKLPDAPPSADIQELLRLQLQNRPATLLLLDNAETITPHEPVVLYIKSLLESVPQLCFLASSRSWFGLGMQEGRVDVNDGLTPWEAFQLFHDRVQERKFALPENVSVDEINALDERLRQTPEYVLPKDRPTTGREHDLLCLLRLFWLANYNSLALELIASWSGKYRTAHELLGNYEKNALGRLTKNPEIPYGDAITQARHKSLESSYLWSWELLGAEENGFDAQSAFLAAALFADTFTDETVDSVLGWGDEDRTADATQAVQDASLIQAVVVADGTQTRYRMHWQLQAFGRDEKLQAASPAPSGETQTLLTTAELRNNFVAYYDQKMEPFDGGQGLGSAESRSWLANEWRNVVAAARYADKAEKWTEAVLLPLYLSGYLQLTSKWRIWEETSLESYQSAVRIMNKWGQSTALNSLGVVYEAQGKWAEAEKVCRQSLAIDHELGDRLGKGQTLNNLGNVYRLQGEWAEAEEVFQESLAVKRELGDRYGEAKTLNNLGNVYQLQGKWAEAEKAYQESLAIMRELGDRYSEGQTLNNLGGVYQLQGKWAEAEAACLEDITICREFGDRYGEGQTLANLALLWMEQRDFDKAAGYARAAVAAFQQTEDGASLEKAQRILARCLAQGGA